MMKLVEVRNDQATTDSLKVAEYFGKEHKDVLESIRGLIKDVAKAEISALGENVDKSMFYEDTYEVENNFRKYPMFYMTKDGWTLLVMGYQGKKATEIKLQYMMQFKKMEQQLARPTIQIQSLPQNYASALRQLADTVEENEQLKVQLEQQDFNRGVIEQLEPVTDVLYTAEEIALENGISSAYRLNKFLKSKRVIYERKKGSRSLMYLYAPHRKKGLKDLSTVRNSQLWTAKGKAYIETLLKEV